MVSCRDKYTVNEMLTALTNWILHTSNIYCFSLYRLIQFSFLESSLKITAYQRKVSFCYISYYFFTAIDDCVTPGNLTLCHNGGECYDLLLDYSCNCTENFFGRNCDAKSRPGMIYVLTSLH